MKFSALFILFILAYTSHGQVLTIGDSQSVGPFGRHLHEKLRHSDLGPIYFNSACGSDISWWITPRSIRCGSLFIHNEKLLNRSKTLQIDGLLKLSSAQTLIIQLGSNYTNYQLRKVNIKKLRSDVKQLLNIIRNYEKDTHSPLKCFWITPPMSRRFAERAEIIHQELSNILQNFDCKVFPSYQYTSYPNKGGDGLHYSFPLGEAIAKKWAEYFYDFFKSEMEKSL